MVVLNREYVKNSCRAVMGLPVTEGLFKSCVPVQKLKLLNHHHENQKKKRKERKKKKFIIDLKHYLILEEMQKILVNIITKTGK